MGASSVDVLGEVFGDTLDGHSISRAHFLFKNMIGILGLLKERGLNLEGKIKFVRHQDKRYDISLLIRANQLEVYQGYQSKPIFKDCNYIVVFIGQEHMKALFFGVYKVLNERPASEVPLPNDFLYPDFDIIGETNVFYDLQEIEGFDDLKNRVVIDWGKGALAWHQWAKDREVTEILPQGYVREFPGFLDFVIRYDELTTIINAPEANREWHIMLSSVAGIYLILDTRDGMQYVGSAYGKNGILGRWKEYAISGHGGNKLLKEILTKDPTASQHFQYTILRTLPKTLTNQEVIQKENLYKNKLGSRAFGLNQSEGTKSIQETVTDNQSIFSSSVTDSTHQELERVLENHTPLAIFPDGLISHEDGWVHARVVAEGFIVPNGFFFFDTGWNAPGAGTGSDHFVEGNIEGPFPPIRELRGHDRYWLIKREQPETEVYLFELTKEPMQNGVDLFFSARNNQEQAERLKDEKYGSRKRAKELTDQYMTPWSE